MADIDILIENGTIVTMDEDRRVLKGSSVAVSGGKIVDLGPAEELRARHQAQKTIDARWKAIMPGLIDLHAHAGMALLKSVGESLPGFEWRNLFDFVAFNSSAEWWYVDSLLGSVDKLKAGTTCSLYMLGAAPRGDAPDFAIANAEAVEKVGIRSIVGVGPSRPPWPKEYSYWKDGKRTSRRVTLEESLEASAEAIRTWQARQSERVQMWISVSRILNPNPADQVFDAANAKYIRPQAEGIRRIMEQYGCGFHLHGYGTTVKFMDEQQFGLLGPKTVVGHGWPFDMETVEILARTDTRVGHCPRARRVYFFKGCCPVPEMIDAGVIVGLGSDACAPDRPFDSLWHDIFMAPRWQRREKNDARLIPPGKALEMATIDGARALNLQDRIGSIEIGKEADIITVDLFKPHTAPVFMEPSRLAHYVRGADVDTVMVQGQVLMENRVVKTVDETEVMEWAQREGERTVEIFGLEPLTILSDRYWRYSSE